MENICVILVNFFLKLFHIRVNKEKKLLFIQIFKFLLVGGMATIIDFVLLYFLKDIIKLDLIIANSLSFIISVIYNYYASITFVFNVDKNNTKVFIIFVLFSAAGLGINNFILWILTNVFKLYYLLSKIIATVFVMIFNFVTRKKFME